MPKSKERRCVFRQEGGKGIIVDLAISCRRNKRGVVAFDENSPLPSFSVEGGET